MSPLSIMSKDDVIHKTGSTEHVASSSEKDRATAAGNGQRFDEVCVCVFPETCEQTDMNE